MSYNYLLTMLTIDNVDKHYCNPEAREIHVDEKKNKFVYFFITQTVYSKRLRRVERTGALINGRIEKAGKIRAHRLSEVFQYSD